MKNAVDAPGRRAVLVSMTKEGGDFMVRLDDAKCRDRALGEWVTDVHYTSKVIAGDAFEKLELDEKELADFGFAILARMHAFNERN